MEIIKQGDETKAAAPKTFGCKVCGCVFSAIRDEYQRILIRGGYEYWAKCPCCGENVLALDETKIAAAEEPKQEETEMCGVLQEPSEPHGFKKLLARLRDRAKNAENK